MARRLSKAQAVEYAKLIVAARRPGSSLRVSVIPNVLTDHSFKIKIAAEEHVRFLATTSDLAEFDRECKRASKRRQQEQLARCLDSMNRAQVERDELAAERAANA